MGYIFERHVKILQNKMPKDTTFRREIIGTPFWAEGQAYKLMPTGVYSGVLVHFAITRGGYREIQDVIS